MAPFVGDARIIYKQSHLVINFLVMKWIDVCNIDVKILIRHNYTRDVSYYYPMDRFRLGLMEPMVCLGFMDSHVAFPSVW